ncbi:MAG: hypothetical protein HY289_09095 [Planctomycetes bacterium]|nr:hypothetical protein [Planctomycetota bacterium]
MKKNDYPPGWDAARVQRVIDHYENMTDEEIIAEDEAAHKAGKNHLPVPGATNVNGKVRHRPKKAKSAAKERKDPRRVTKAKAKG